MFGTDRVVLGGPVAELVPNLERKVQQSVHTHLAQARATASNWPLGAEVCAIVGALNLH